MQWKLLVCVKWPGFLETKLVQLISKSANLEVVDLSPVQIIFILMKHVNWFFKSYPQPYFFKSIQWGNCDGLPGVGKLLQILWSCQALVGFSLHSAICVWVKWLGFLRGLWWPRSIVQQCTDLEVGGSSPTLVIFILKSSWLKHNYSFGYSDSDLVVFTLFHRTLRIQNLYLQDRWVG